MTSHQICHTVRMCRQRRCKACLQVSASMIQSATSLPPVGIVDDLQQCSASDDGICPVDTMQTQAGLTERRFICLLEVRLQQQAIEEHVVVTKWHLQRMSSHSISFCDICPASYAIVILAIAMSFLQAFREPYTSSVLSSCCSSNRGAHAKVTFLMCMHHQQMCTLKNCMTRAHCACRCSKTDCSAVNTRRSSSQQRCHCCPTMHLYFNSVQHRCHKQPCIL